MLSRLLNKGQLNQRNYSTYECSNTKHAVFLYNCGKDGAVTGTHEAARHSISMPKRLCPKVSSVFAIHLDRSRSKWKLV